MEEMEDTTEPELVKLVNDAAHTGTRDWFQLTGTSPPIIFSPLFRASTITVHLRDEHNTFICYGDILHIMLDNWHCNFSGFIQVGIIPDAPFT